MADSQDFKPLAEEFASDKIYCANCRHCKLVKMAVGSASQFGLRVRCEAGKWRKKLGEEKIYKYFTVIRRTLEECDSYEPMGEVEVFLKELRKSLPIRDELSSG
jgi:hypothetical protein